MKKKNDSFPKNYYEKEQFYDHVFYWSFRFGILDAPKSEWWFDDIKIPAAGILEAICIYNWMRGMKTAGYDYKENIMRMQNPMNFIPTREVVLYKWKQILKFKRISSVGKTRVNFKLMQTYNVHDFILLFPESSNVGLTPPLRRFLLMWQRKTLHGK